MFLVNSRRGLSSAAPSGSGSLPHPNRAPLLPKLRGHFAEFLSRASPARLRILSSPTCVGLRYGHPNTSLRGFSRQSELGQFGTPISLPIAPQDLSPADLPARAPSVTWTQHLQRRAAPTLLRHPFAQTVPRWYRNINRFPIAYASRPRLRPRLTLGGRAFPRNP